MKTTTIVILLLLSITAQAFNSGNKTHRKAPRLGKNAEVDELTIANINQVRILDAEYRITIDFDNKSLSGVVTYQMEMQEANVSEIKLDAWQLKAQEAYFAKEITSDDSDWDDISDRVKRDVNVNSLIGGDFTILAHQLWDDGFIPKETSFFLKLHYNTTPFTQRNKARTGFQFLNSENGGGPIPIFYTQNAPVYLRTFIPSQDSPQIYYSWTAHITVPTGIPAYVSGEYKDMVQGQQTDEYIYDSHYDFLPANTFSIFAGQYQKKQLQSTYLQEISVICDPVTISVAEMLLQNVDEQFKELDNYLFLQEKIEKINIIMMPANYPFPGAAHPGMFYIHQSAMTATVTGKSIFYNLLGNHIFGNRVMIKSWRNLWMNLGFAQYIERRLLSEIGEVYGPLDAIQGNYMFEQDIKSFPSGINDNLTMLYPLLDLPDPTSPDEYDPDNLFNEVPIEKGYQFLKHLEGLVNDASSDRMRVVLKEWAKQDEPVNYLDFKDFLENLANNNPGFTDVKEKILGISWDSWIKGKGYPPVEFTEGKDTIEYRDAWSLADKYIQFDGTAVPKNFAQWDSFLPDQKYIFMDTLLYNRFMMGKRLTADLDKRYRFEEQVDSNIKWRWYTLICRNKYNLRSENTSSLVQLFLSTTGRYDFLVPIYQALLDSNQDDLAKEYLDQNEDYYHPFVYDFISYLINGEVVD